MFLKQELKERDNKWVTGPFYLNIMKRFPKRKFQSYFPLPLKPVYLICESRNQMNGNLTRNRRMVVYETVELFAQMKLEID